MTLVELWKVMPRLSTLHDDGKFPLSLSFLVCAPLDTSNVTILCHLGSDVKKWRGWRNPQLCWLNPLFSTKGILACDRYLLSLTSGMTNVFRVSQVHSTKVLFEYECIYWLSGTVFGRESVTNSSIYCSFCISSTSTCCSVVKLSYLLL